MEFIMLNSGEDQPPNSLIEKKLQVNNYECMYCKHGFTNAQALGGHMNVHRKHRAKKINSSSSNNINSIRKQQDQTREYLMLTSSIPAAAAYGTTPAVSPQEEEVMTSLSLSLQFGRRSHLHHHQEEEESIDDQGAGADDEVVDLELRLGN